MFNIAWFILALLLLAAAFAELIVNSYFPMWMLFAMAVLCFGIGQILQTLEDLFYKLNYMTSCLNEIDDKLYDLERKDK